MSTLLAQLDEKIVELINAGTPPAGVPQAQPERTFALDGEKDLPAISVRRLQTIPLRNLVPLASVPLPEPILELITTYAVDCYARGGAERPTAAADPMVVWVWKACVGQTQSTGDDPRLFYQIQLGNVIPNIEQSDHPYNCTRVELHVYHQTRADDPEAFE